MYRLLGIALDLPEYIFVGPMVEYQDGGETPASPGYTTCRVEDLNDPTCRGFFDVHLFAYTSNVGSHSVG